MQLQKRASAEGGGNFLKIKDGDSAVGVFRGDIHSFKIRWENGKSHVLDEPEKARHNRYKVNFVTKDGGGFVAKTWEFGNSVYDQLYDISTETDITKTKIKVTRRGAGMDTSYTLVPIGSVDSGTLSQINDVKLNILNGRKDEDGPNLAPATGDDDVPF